MAYMAKKKIGSHLLKTPYVNEISKKSMIFKNTYTSPICSPSRFSLITGISTGHSPVRGNPGTKGQDYIFKPTKNVQPFPLTLKNNGYDTTLIGKYGFANNPAEIGFVNFHGLKTHEENHSCFPSKIYNNKKTESFRYNRFKLKNARHYSGLCSKTNLNDESDCIYYHDVITSKALEYIRAKAKMKEEPFFLQVSYTTPHVCSWNSNLKAPYPRVLAVPFVNYKSCPLAKNGQPPKKKLFSNECNFQSMITNYFDRDIGKIVNLTKEVNIEENTIIIISSDNGPSNQYDKFNEMIHNTDTFDSLAGLKGGKRTVYEGGIRVPMLIKWPRYIHKRQVIDERIYLHDLTATFIQLATDKNFETSNSLQYLNSNSLVPVLVGNKKFQIFHDTIYIEFCDRQKLNWRYIKKKPSGYCSYTIILENTTKFIYDSSNKKTFLYDLKSDPYEEINLINTISETTLKMLKNARHKYKDYRSLKDTGYKGSRKLNLKFF